MSLSSVSPNVLAFYLIYLFDYWLYLLISSLFVFWFFLFFFIVYVMSDDVLFLSNTVLFCPKWDKLLKWIPGVLRRFGK